MNRIRTARLTRRKFLSQSIAGALILSRHALSEAAPGHSSLFRHVGEGSVAIVFIKSVAQRCFGDKKITFAAVHQIDVHPAVVVIVEKCDTWSGALREVLFRGMRGIVHPSNSALLRRNYLEGKLGSVCLRKDGAPRQNQGSCDRLRQEVPPGQSCCANPIHDFIQPISNCLGI